MRKRSFAKSMFLFLFVGMLIAPHAAAAEPVATVSGQQVGGEHNKKGIVGRFVLGGSAPTSDEGDALDAVGLRIGGTVGYQIPLTAKISLTPEIWIDYSSWSGDHDVSTKMFVFAVGAQADYFFFDNLSGWGGVHLGGGSVSSDPGDQSKGGFALAIDAGATYYLHKHVGVGAFIGVSSVFAGKDDQTQIDFSATSFDFGLQVRGAFAI